MARIAPPVLDHPTVLAAGVLLHRPDPAGRQWLLLCNRKRNEWGFPKGHVDPGETLIDAALRECAEETGIAVLALRGAPFELVYRIPGGQAKRVSYFAATTRQHGVTLSKEHVAFRWCTDQAAMHLLPHDNLRRCFAANLRRLDAGRTC